MLTLKERPKTLVRPNGADLDPHFKSAAKKVLSRVEQLQHGRLQPDLGNRGMPWSGNKVNHSFQRHEIAESIIKDTGARIQFHRHNPHAEMDYDALAEAHRKGVDYDSLSHSSDACFMWIPDIAILPHREQFAKELEFYGTAFHELGHWTGNRLGRPVSGCRCIDHAHEYAREECIAELSSAMVLEAIGLGARVDYSAVYVNNMTQAPGFDIGTHLPQALHGARRAAHYVLNSEGLDGFGRT
jgi:hypothetical protein